MYVARRITIFDLINNQAILKVFNTLKYHFAKKKIAEYHRQWWMQHVKAGTDCILLTEKHTSVSKMKEEGLIFFKKTLQILWKSLGDVILFWWDKLFCGLFLSKSQYYIYIFSIEMESNQDMTFTYNFWKFEKTVEKFSIGRIWLPTYIFRLDFSQRIKKNCTK